MCERGSFLYLSSKIHTQNRTKFRTWASIHAQKPKPMSYHHEFHSAEDEFLEDVDNQEQLDAVDAAGAGADDDVALDEYEMVFYYLFFF